MNLVISQNQNTSHPEMIGYSFLIDFSTRRDDPVSEAYSLISKRANEINAAFEKSCNYNLDEEKKEMDYLSFALPRIVVIGAISLVIMYYSKYKYIARKAREQR